MWQLINRTPFAAAQTWLRGLDGAETWIVVVKATYDLRPDGTTAVSARQLPVVRVPVWFGEPGASSLQYDNDFVLGKCTTDVIVNGCAHAPRGEAATSLDVGLRVGDLTKVLRVQGDRQWGTSAAWMSQPTPFLAMPLRYERAFGGRDDSAPDTWSTANPVGQGFAVSRVAAEARPVPNIEYPGEPITGWNDRPRPAGFGCIAPHWDERARWAGTYDDVWEQTRQPLLPADFDMRHHQAAPADQQTAAFLQGGEPVTLVNMSPDGPVRFNLPVVRLALRTRFGKRDPVLDHPVPVLHTVLIEPDARRVSLVWHSAVECHARVYELDHTRICFADDLKSPDDEATEDLLGL